MNGRNKDWKNREEGSTLSNSIEVRKISKKGQSSGKIREKL